MNEYNAIEILGYLVAYFFYGIGFMMILKAVFKSLGLNNLKVNNSKLLILSVLLLYSIFFFYKCIFIDDPIYYVLYYIALSLIVGVFWSAIFLGIVSSVGKKIKKLNYFELWGAFTVLSIAIYFVSR